MKTIFDHIEQIKGKPHHVRKRIAIGTAAAGSGFIALIWLIGSFATNAFAIQGSSFAMSTGQAPVATTSASGTSGEGLAGAAAALKDAQAPAHIDIVDTSVAPTQKAPEQTTIPF